VVRTTVVLVQYYCDLCSDYCGYGNSRFCAKLLFYVGVYCGYSNSTYSAIILCFAGVYCGYSKSIYSAKVL